MQPGDADRSASQPVIHSLPERVTALTLHHGPFCAARDTREEWRALALPPTDRREKDRCLASLSPGERCKPAETVTATRLR